MGVKIIENWTALVGHIEEIQVSEAITNFHVATVFVIQANDVDDYPNMLADTVNSSIECYIPDEVCQRLEVTSGMQLTARVRHAPQNRNFVHTREISVETRNSENEEVEGFLQRLFNRLRPSQS